MSSISTIRPGAESRRRLHRLRARRIRTRVAAAALAAALLGQAGCGSDAAQHRDQATGGDDVPVSGIVEEGALAPAECLEVYAVALGGDLDNVTLRPADWPEVYPQASVCNVSATVDERQQDIDYATAASRAEILDAFEGELRAVPGYDVERTRSEERGYDLLTGRAGDVGFQIDPRRDGAYTVTFLAP